MKSLLKAEAGRLVNLLGYKLIGLPIEFIISDVEIGVATVTKINPDPAAPEIVLTTEIGICCFNHEHVGLDPLLNHLFQGDGLLRDHALTEMISKRSLDFENEAFDDFIEQCKNTTKALRGV